MQSQPGSNFAGCHVLAEFTGVEQQPSNSRWLMRGRRSVIESGGVRADRWPAPAKSRLDNQGCHARRLPGHAVEFDQHRTQIGTGQIYLAAPPRAREAAARGDNGGSADPCIFGRRRWVGDRAVAADPARRNHADSINS